MGNEISFFLYAVDLAVCNPVQDIQPIVSNIYLEATNYYYQESCREYVRQTTLNGHESTRYFRRGEQNQHIIQDGSAEGIAQQITNTIVETRSFVVVDINLIENIANHLNFLGCTVRVADDLEPNESIENDEIYYSNFRLPEQFDEVDIEAEAVEHHENPVYGRLIEEETLSLNDLLDLMGTPLASAEIPPNVSATTADVFYSENRMVLFTPADDQQEASANTVNANADTSDNNTADTSNENGCTIC